MKRLIVEKARDGLFYGLAITLAVCLKQYYSHAGSDDLLWILYPVAGLVKWAGNTELTYEPYAGFINRDCRIIISPACAGINLLIVSFTMAVFIGIRYMADVKRKILWCCFSAAAAYALVIGVNALRIYLSMACYSSDLGAGWLTPARSHRLLGIVIYFFFHCWFYLIMRKVAIRYGKETDISREKTALFGPTPLCWYLGITLVVPFINAAYRNNIAQFVEHGLFVISGSCVVLGVIFLIRKGFNLQGKRFLNYRLGRTK